MAVNQYFRSSYFGKGEQNLLNGLVRETIQRHGYDISYMPRETVNLDYLYGEDAQANFGIAIPLEAYIKDNRGYTGAGDSLAKFGLDIQDDFTLQIHIDRFEQEVSTRFNNIIRPREGDLIYFGLDKHSMFEITFVENKIPYYQEGAIYLYTISLSRFVMGGERIATDIPEIDEIMLFGSSVDITLGALISISTKYKIGEIAYQSTQHSLATATASGEVLEQVNNTLRLGNVKGVFASGLNIIGNTTLTEYTFPIKSDTTFDDTTTQISDNKNVRKESNTILDFDEKNPFLDTGYN